MKDLSRITPLQVEVLNVLWDLGEATAHEVHERLAETTGLARKTIGTLLHRLEKQGVLKHRQEGRAYYYRPRVTREQFRNVTVREVVGQLFQGDFPAMVSFALEAGEVEADDVRRIQEMMQQWQARSRR